MKISELLKQKKPIFSCEFFPPKTEEGMSQLYETAREIKALEPGFISVTYGAGGGTRDKTIEIVRKIKQEIGIESMAHLTCVGHSLGELKSALVQIQNAGIENVIALRGDPPKGSAEFAPHPDGFKHAIELVELIRKNFNFCVAVAGYPEGHVEAPNKEMDWANLEMKVRAGGDVIITQLFFDNKAYFSFEKKIREKGVTVPILPGIMPITNYNQIVKFTQMCGAKIPDSVQKDLEPIKNDLEAVQEYGINFATRQCEELLMNGAPGIHFYTLNRSGSAKKIVENLKRKKRLY